MPLLLSFGVVDVELLGVLDELDDDGVLDDELDDGGVLDDDEDVSGAVDEELDDIEPLGDVVVAGGVVVDDDDDVDGDGVTTGGVVPVVVDVSRLQPAMPRTSPVQSNVTIALLIAISRS